MRWRADEPAIWADVLSGMEQALTSQATFELRSVFRDSSRSRLRPQRCGNRVFVEAEAQDIVGAVHDHAAASQAPEDLEIGLGVVGADASAQDDGVYVGIVPPRRERRDVTDATMVGWEEMSFVGGRICGDEPSELRAVLFSLCYVKDRVMTECERVFHLLVGAGENGGEGRREETLFAQYGVWDTDEKRERQGRVPDRSRGEADDTRVGRGENPAPRAVAAVVVHLVDDDEARRVRRIERERGDDGDVVGQAVAELAFDGQFVDDDDGVVVVGADERVDDERFSGACRRDDDAARLGGE